MAGRIAKMLLCLLLVPALPGGADGSPLRGLAGVLADHDGLEAGGGEAAVETCPLGELPLFRGGQCDEQPTCGRCVPAPPYAAGLCAGPGLSPRLGRALAGLPGFSIELQHRRLLV